MTREEHKRLYMQDIAQRDLVGEELFEVLYEVSQLAGSRECCTFCHKKTIQNAIDAYEKLMGFEEAQDASD